MIEPREIGAPRRTESQPPTARRRTGRAIVPGTDEVREVELFDATPAPNRREEVITGDNSTFRYLRFARILLDGGAPMEVSLAADHEAIFYLNRGDARLTVEGETHSLTRGDVLYLPIGGSVTIEAEGVADLSEFRATECHTRYPVQLVRHSDIEGTPLAADLGSKRPMTKRTVFKLVDKNVQACRLLFGDTYPAGPGAVGSYPPHFHGAEGAHGLGADAKEEIYHFRVASEIEGDTPFVLQNCARPGEAVNTYVHVFDEQAINVTPSFHDTIAPPAIDFMFTWCLGSYTENNRDWARILNRPGYENEW